MNDRSMKELSKETKRFIRKNAKKCGKCLAKTLLKIEKEAMNEK